MPEDKIIVNLTKDSKGFFSCDIPITKEQWSEILHNKTVDGAAKSDYIKQLCGYARDTKLLSKLDIDCTDEDAVPIVPCTLIYPDVLNKNIEKFDLFKSHNKRTIKYYTTTIEIPKF